MSDDYRLPVDRSPRRRTEGMPKRMIPSPEQRIVADTHYLLFLSTVTEVVDSYSLCFDSIWMIAIVR